MSMMGFIFRTVAVTASGDFFKTRTPLQSSKEFPKNFEAK